MHRNLLMSAWLALTLALALVVSGCSTLGALGTGTNTVTAYFTDSAGLFEGNEVGILGVAVGTVRKIEPVGDRVKATLEVDSSYDVPADARAVIVPRSVATDRYVELTPVYRQGPTLEDGAVIDTDRTATPVDFDDVLSAINTFATEIGGSRHSRRAIQRIINQGAAALEGNGRLFNRTVTRLANATNGLSSQRQDFAASLVSLDALVTEIAANQGTAREFVQQVSRASRMLAEEREEFRRAMRALDQAVTTVAEFTRNNRGEFVDALGNVTTTMDVMLSRRRQLTEVLEVMPLAMQNLQRAKTDDNQVRVRAPEEVLLGPVFGEILVLLCTDGALAGLGAPLCELVVGE